MLNLSSDQLLQVADACDAALGMHGGVIIVRNQDEREAVTTELTALAKRTARAIDTGHDDLVEKVTVVVVPGADRIYWRAKYAIT